VSVCVYDLETSVLYFYMGVIVKKPAALILTTIYVNTCMHIFLVVVFPKNQQPPLARSHYCGRARRKKARERDQKDDQDFFLGGVWGAVWRSVKMEGEENLKNVCVSVCVERICDLVA